MRFLYYILALIFVSIQTLAANATSTLAFSPQTVAEFEWGSGNKQVALIKAPANNFGPPRLALNDSGTVLYLLDAPNQRIIVFNITTQHYAEISISTDIATDFCVLDEGQHFYLLADQDKQVMLYNAEGKQLRTYPINASFEPLAIQCSPQRGLAFQATDGHFYPFDKDKPLTYTPAQGYDFLLDKQDDKQGTLWLHFYADNLTQEVAITTHQGSLETLDIVGIDQQKRVYLTVEELDNSQAATVSRFLRQYDAEGKLAAEVEIPYSLFAYTLQDLVVSAKGEVFQLIPLREHVKIVKWVVTDKGLTQTRSANPLRAQLFSYLNPQADDFLPSEADDIDSEDASRSRGYRSLAPIDRDRIMQKAKAFANHRYYVKGKNITGGRHVGNKLVVTPIRRAGYYTGVPYKWGGFNDLRSFKSGLQQGKYAGDKCTSKCSGKYSGSRSAVGVDCSGFVSQVWGLKRKESTSTLPQVSTKLTTFNRLKRGDILNKRGHVRLFSHRDTKGKFWVYEASARDWKVNKHKYSAYQLKRDGYKPYRYKKVKTLSDSSPAKKSPRYSYKRPVGLYLYGKKAIREGQSSRYRARVFYANGTHKDITHRTKWGENSRYANFSGSKLYTRYVKHNHYVRITASYTENSQTLTSTGFIIIRDSFRWRSRGRGPEGIAEMPSAIKQPPVDIEVRYIHYPEEGHGASSELTGESTLYSGDHYQIRFTPNEDAYVYVFQVDSAQNIYQIFPLQTFKGVTVNSSNPVTLNQQQSIPSSNQRFVLDNQVGEEIIYFLASREPLPEFEQFTDIENASEDKKIELRRRLENCQNCVNSIKFSHR